MQEFFDKVCNFLLFLLIVGGIAYFATQHHLESSDDPPVRPSGHVTRTTPPPRPAFHPTANSLQTGSLEPGQHFSVFDKGPELPPSGRTAQICGYVLMPTLEGIVVTCAVPAQRARIRGAPVTGWLPQGAVLIEDMPQEGKINPNDLITCVTGEESGTYEFTSVRGTTQTIPAFRYIGGH